MTMKKSIFLPVETMSREYQYKIVLATKLANEGFRVVLGHAPHLDKIKSYFPPGAYIGKNLFKTLFPTELSIYKSYKNNGWSLIHLDEEGAIFAGGKEEWKQELNGRLDPRVLGSDDKVLCWGEFQAEHYRTVVAQMSAPKIVATGQPKFSYNDLLYKQVLDLDISFNEKFILFNMNYSVFNDQLGISYFLETNDSYRTDEIENFEYKRSIWLDQLSNFGSILSIIQRMLKDECFNDFKFVVRPHPAENDCIYKTFFEKNERVIVTNCHTAVEWSKKAYCTIHDGCTTGVEAYLSGCKVIHYREQFNHEAVINVIPNSVGYNATSYSELKKIVLGENENDILKNKELCHMMISNFDKTLNSFQRVVDETVITLSEKKAGYVSKKLFVHDFLHKIISLVKYYARYAIPSKQALYIKEKKKFPGFKSKDVYSLIKKVNSSGVNVDVVKFAKEYIIIEKV
ncbi:surface carbohydrate biosynthesis protein [Vibrio metoecus]|uniref:surface carbohydrate biosynthesis protein n=1 Tax=Vibrio metoecus TaxID=1481663 RepID=UPI0012AE0468|nr:surface carbohydrate biosynthesis protein [Vibrio metoecus]